MNKGSSLQAARQRHCQAVVLVIQRCQPSICRIVFYVLGKQEHAWLGPQSLNITVVSLSVKMAIVAA